jgi:hypothetical protein
MPLSDAQIDEAISQMKVQCDLKMANYEMVSARSVLNELGYQSEAVEEVLDRIFSGGFSYCLDSKYPAKDMQGSVTQDVCYWGPDQLKSRLDSLWFPKP